MIYICLAYTWYTFDAAFLDIHVDVIAAESPPTDRRRGAKPQSSPGMCVEV